MRLERSNDEGYSLGSLSLNYGVTLVCFCPVARLAYFKVIGPTPAIIGALGVLVLLYRPSRSWWLMNYYLVLPTTSPPTAAPAGGRRRKYASL